MNFPQPGKMNLTLVAFYGGKPDAVGDLISGLQAELTRLLGFSFRPYGLEQVHATVSGLEGRRIGTTVLNTNYLESRQELRAIDLDAVLTVLRDATYLPFRVRIGGYQAAAAFPFTSRGLHPYVRSFSIQGEIAVAIGWPFDDTGHIMVLDQLRRKLGDAGVLHKYHGKLADVDNDFFFVVGRVLTRELEADEIHNVQDHMRAYLASRSPVDMTIDREALSLVGYIDETLPLHTSCRFSLAVAEKTTREILALYRDGSGLTMRWS